jgi:hypothetical protein
MEVNYAELRKQSRVAAWLTAIATLIVLGSLVWSSWETRNARRDVYALAKQKAELQQEIGPLDKRVRMLILQKEKLEQADKGQSAALNALVENDLKATNILEQAARKDSLVAQSVPRIFIHQHGEKQVASDLAKNLRMRGYVVLAPDEKSDGFGTRIVFFNGPDDPETHSDVEAIKDAMKQVDPKLNGVRAQWDNQHHHPGRTYAIWIQSDDAGK